MENFCRHVWHMNWEIRVRTSGRVFLANGAERLNAAASAEKRGCMSIDGVCNRMLELQDPLVGVTRLNLPPRQNAWHLLPTQTCSASDLEYSAERTNIRKTSYHRRLMSDIGR